MMSCDCQLKRMAIRWHVDVYDRRLSGKSNRISVDERRKSFLSDLIKQRMNLPPCSLSRIHFNQFDTDRSTMRIQCRDINTDQDSFRRWRESKSTFFSLIDVWRDDLHRLLLPFLELLDIHPERGDGRWKWSIWFDYLLSPSSTLENEHLYLFACRTDDSICSSMHVFEANCCRRPTTSSRHLTEICAHLSKANRLSVSFLFFSFFLN